MTYIHPGSNKDKKELDEKIFCGPTFFCRDKFSKIKIRVFYFLKVIKNLSKLTKNLSIFDQKYNFNTLQKYGCNPGSEIRKKLIPDTGDKKAPDLGSRILNIVQRKK
jgi:hypothetical protein